MRTVSPKRYASAVFQIALARNQIDLWMDGLRFLTDSLSNSEVLRIIDAPQISTARKMKFTRKIFDGFVSPIVLNLVFLLASRNVTYSISKIFEEFQEIVDVYRGIGRASVTTAVPIDRKDLTKLVNLLEKITECKIEIDTKVDSKILGGLVAKVGDRVIDGSTRTKLQVMHRRIVTQTR